MKKALFVCLLAIVIGCSKKDTPKPESQTGLVSVIVKQNSKLPTGQIVANAAPSLIYVWKADGRDFDLTKTADFIKGYAYDKTSGSSVKYDYPSNNPFVKSLTKGKYFVYVVLTSDGYGQFAYSYTYFNVNAETNSVTKIFTTNASGLYYEDWNTTE